MGLDCLIHGHDWQEGRCAKCGKKLGCKKKSLASFICKKKGHLWTGCRCARCGLRRMSNEVNYHKWVDGNCRCLICGNSRPDDYEGHKWVSGSDTAWCLECSLCGHIISHKFDNAGICTRCKKSAKELGFGSALRNRERGYRPDNCPGHDWEHHVRVPFGPGTVYGKRCKKCGKIEYYDIKV